MKAVALALFVSSALALNNGLALKPQMGWNSWNHFYCNVNETLIHDTIKVFAANHRLRTAGYNYINVDDCWAGFRDAQGKIHADPKTFPNGMKPLADAAHSVGLYFGLYSDAGTNTCAGRPGSLGFEKQDADSYASWGVDYLKYDNCNNKGIAPQLRYPPMRDALNNTGRKIFFSMCEWGVNDPATWAPEVGNSWRTTGDIGDNWASMISRADLNDKWYKYAAPGGWNDPDMLEIGNGGMSDTEYRTHFSLWCLMKAPLLIGCDLTRLTEATLEILTAPEVIAVNQDAMGVQGHKISSSNNLEVWAGPLHGGKHVVALVNRSGATATVTAEWSTLGLNSRDHYTVRDLWARRDLGTFQTAFSRSVPSHGTVLVSLSRA